MDEKQKPRRPRIGERRDSFGRGNSENGFKKSYNNNRPNYSYGSDYRTKSYNNDYYSRNDEGKRYESNRYDSYNKSDRPQQRRSDVLKRYGNGNSSRSFNNNREGYNAGGNRFERPSQINTPTQPIPAPTAKNKKKNKKRIIPEPILYKAPYSPDEPIRLNKYLSTAGVCSRREADEMIQRGEVMVNGKVILELGTKILFGDVVSIKDKVITPEHKVYVLLNKPKNCVTTTKDPEGRLTVLDIIRKA